MEELKDNSFDILQYLNNIIGGEIKIFEPISSDKVWFYVGQTEQFVDQNSPTGNPEALKKFHGRCRELVDQLVAQEVTGLETVIEDAKRLLEPEVPSLWHAYLYVTSHNAHLTLVVVFDRPSSLSEQAESNILTIIPDREVPLLKDDLDYLDPVKGRKDVTVEAEEQVSFISLPSETNGSFKDEVTPQSVELKYLNPTMKEICETLVEELKRLGKDFWVCQYNENPADLYSVEGPPIQEQIAVLVNTGELLQLNYLRCLVWFGLGAEKSRNVLSLSFGDFLVIRSEQHPYLVAIVKLDWDCLARLTRDLRTCDVKT